MAILDEVMSRYVYTAPATTPVSEVASAMVKGRFGSALVMSGTMLIGIFTERDVLRAAASGVPLPSSPISQWMTRDPETATPGTDAETALQLMLSGGFRHLPVLDGNTVVGVVSLRDVLGTRIRRAT